jgi:tetratricopeptide (TPR) repeat protein
MLRGGRLTVVLAGVTALGPGLVGCGGKGSGAGATACEVAGAELDVVWHESAQTGVREAFLATGEQDARTTADKALHSVGEQAQAWKRARTEICLHTEAREWSDDLLARAVWCLDDRRSELEVLVEEFTRANATVVQTAELAAADLRPVEACLDRALLLRQPAPPTHGREELRAAHVGLARARTLQLAGDYAAALKLATETRGSVEQTLAWPPVWAAARACEGLTLALTGAYATAETASSEAYHAAVSAEAWDVAAEAASDLIDIVGFELDRREDGRAWARHAEMAIARAGDRLGLREAGRLINLATVELMAGAPAEAEALLRRALALREAALGPDHRAVAQVLNNLAEVQRSEGALAEAAALLERSLKIAERTQGPEHPGFAVTLSALARVRQAMGALPEAREMFKRVVAIREKALGPEHRDLARSLGLLGEVERDLAAYAEARALLERALAIQEKALPRGDFELGVTLGLLASVHLADGRPLDAVALLERKVTLFAATPIEFIARFELAKALTAAGQDDARALAEARRARDGFAAAGASDNVAEIDAWLVEHSARKQ